MGFDKICSVLALFIVINNGSTQEIATQKCSEYVFRQLRALQYHQIVGGSRTADNEFPHMAALGFGSNNRPVWLCGGTLISDQFVLTAAHCTHIRSIGSVKVVRLGSRTLTPRPGSSHKDIKVAQIIRHPKYSPPTSYNDIALLKLQRKVQFSKSILPACLYTGFKANLATSTLTALGWGKTDFAGPNSDDLLKIELRVTSRNQCNRNYMGLSRRKLPGGISDATQLCAGGEIEKDTCQGDSGGPLEYNNGKFHYIIGITSFGKACGISMAPGVYTRVSAFVPWIEAVVWQ